MKRAFSKSIAALGLVAAVFAVIDLVGCATAPIAASAGGDGRPPANAGAAQLWAQNCAHCHNIRTPSAYSDMQWDVVSLHMRVRGNLTADEHRTILAFLKSAH